MNPDRLVYMANQIAKGFRLKTEDRAVADTLDHIQKFWEPRMRREILAVLASGGDGLEPIARKAVEQIKVS
ncbi:NAD-dependent formate dehydrogenase [Hypericibacter terrae]|uniref:NAD-dependent formate dehydrogenase n=1 Tax=Hypericibacter terrae TaxID=2602015 RepID=A0A5J6MJJ6_9PROT|nr:formate dehydrogenase subunit delta [Hypericibacter terrae]QEX14876.1 NAD-dependent formate dehydrogenase [Hypericibacter terrae]